MSCKILIHTVPDESSQLVLNPVLRCRGTLFLPSANVNTSIRLKKREYHATNSFQATRSQHEVNDSKSFEGGPASGLKYSNCDVHSVPNLGLIDELFHLVRWSHSSIAKKYPKRCPRMISKFCLLCVVNSFFCFFLFFKEK